MQSLHKKCLNSTISTAFLLVIDSFMRRDPGTTLENHLLSMLFACHVVFPAWFHQTFFSNSLAIKKKNLNETKTPYFTDNRKRMLYQGGQQQTTANLFRHPS